MSEGGDKTDGLVREVVPKWNHIYEFLPKKRNDEFQNEGGGSFGFFQKTSTLVTKDVPK